MMSALIPFLPNEKRRGIQAPPGFDPATFADSLGDTAYGQIIKARSGYGPDLGRTKDELAQTDRYLEGSAHADDDIFGKLLKLGIGAGYEGAKGYAQNTPGGRNVWNGTIGNFSDFAMDKTTSPASLNNVLAYAKGMFRRR